MYEIKNVLYVLLIHMIGFELLSSERDIHHKIFR